MLQRRDDLTRKRGADTLLLGILLFKYTHFSHSSTYSAARLLRSLGSIGAVGEVGDVGQEAYVPTKVTRTFVIPTLAAGVECWYVTALPYN